MGQYSHVFSLAKSKAAFWVALLGVLAIGGYWGLSAAVESKARGQMASLVGGATSENKALLEDTDNDGLPSWEETLFKTDPANPDTDGDGVNDGEEIKGGRDPLAQGVGDLKSRNENLISSNGELTTELTKALIDSGALGDALNGKQASLPDSFLKNIGSIYSETQAKTVNEGLRDLRYTPVGDSQAIKKYFNDVASIYLRRFSELQKIDFEIFAAIVEDKNKSENLALLEGYVSATEASWNDYKNIEAPLALKDFHERGAKLLLQMLFELRAFQNYDADPALSLLALNNRLQTRVDIAKLYQIDAKTIFGANKIVFKAEDAGNKMFGW